MRKSILFSILTLIALILFGGVLYRVIYVSLDKYNDTRLQPLQLSETRIDSTKQYNALFFGDSHAKYWKDDKEGNINLGIAGQTSQQIRLRYDLIENQIKGGGSLILSVGANDIKSIATNPDSKDKIVSNCIQNIEYLILSNRNKFHNIHIITIPPDFKVSFPYQFINYEDTVEAKLTLNEQIKLLAKKHNCILIDTYAIFKDKLGDEYSSDGVHMNHKAYDILNNYITYDIID